MAPFSFPLISKSLPERGDQFAEDWAQCCHFSAYVFAGVGFAHFVYRGHGITMVAARCCLGKARYMD
jgi:hypothetical protein